MKALCARVCSWTVTPQESHGIFQARILEWVAIPDTGIKPASLASSVLEGRQIVVYVCKSQSPSSLCPSSPPWCSYVCSLCLCLYSCPGNRFICTIFFQIPHVCVNVQYFFFLQVHPHHCKWHSIVYSYVGLKASRVYNGRDLCK